MVEVGLQRPVDKRLLTRTIAHLPSVVAAEQKDDRTLKIRFSGGLDAQGSILSDLVKLKIGVVSYRPASSELEDAYLKLIKDTL